MGARVGACERSPEEHRTRGRESVIEGAAEHVALVRGLGDHRGVEWDDRYTSLLDQLPRRQYVCG
jgi:hypothetical protein